MASYKNINFIYIGKCYYLSSFDCPDYPRRRQLYTNKNIKQQSHKLKIERYILILKNNLIIELPQNLAIHNSIRWDKWV